MNKHLEAFIEDELTNNNYYETIRKFAEGKDFAEVVGDVIASYDNNIDNFTPYRFMDAIENYLKNLYESDSPLVVNCESLAEIIDDMWEHDGFELY